MAYSVFSKENIFIALGALALSLALILPRQISTCPKGLTYDPVLGGSCPLFVDANEDRICDLVQGVSAPAKSGFDFSFTSEFFAFLALFIIAAALSLVKPKSKFRYLTMAAGIALGVWTWRRICPLGTLQLLFLQKDKIVLLLFPFLVFLIPIIAALIVGQVFCFWICPIGALQEFIWRLARWIAKKVGAGSGPRRGRIPSRLPSEILLKIPDFTNKIPRYINNVNYLLFVILVAGTVYFGEAVFCKICPLGFIFGCSKISTALVILIFALLFLIFAFLYRPFCHFLCPYGAILKLLSKFSLRNRYKRDGPLSKL